MAILSMFKSKNKNNIWQWSEDREIRYMKLDVGSGTVDDNKNCRSYHSAQECIMKDHIKGGLTLAVWQRDAFPKNPFCDIDEAKKKQLSDIDAIAEEAGRVAKDKAIEDTRRNKLLNMFVTLGYVFGITVLIAFGWLIYQNGGIEFSL